MRKRETKSQTPQWTIDDVVYDPETHTSKLPDGTDVPHVTRILCAVGVTEDFEALMEKHERLGRVVELARLRGRAVHEDCHAFDDDDLDWMSVDERIKPWVMAWAEVREAMRLKPIARERRIFHPVYCYTGIKDGLFERDGKRILVDIKTGDPEDAAGHLQTAAYEEAERALRPNEPPIDERWAIRLAPGLKIPYRITNYSARPDAYLDKMKFLACLTVFREQPKNRRR